MLRGEPEHMSGSEREEETEMRVWTETGIEILRVAGAIWQTIGGLI